MTLQMEKVHELLYEAAETEKGGVQVYETAVQCARNPELREEWEEYLEQTRRHVEITEELLDAFELDPDKETPGRRIVRSLGEALVDAMRQAQSAGDPDAAEIVAGECVVLAETKDHLNWKLLAECAQKLEDGEQRDALEEAVEEVEDEEDEHLYHSAGWTRELWLEALGVGGVLPPPEERRDVKSAVEAARAEKQRKRLAPRRRSAPRSAAKSSSRGQRSKSSRARTKTR